jgi:Transposase DDE domain
MFICEKSKRAKGKEYTQHQLMESVRTPAGPRQRLVLNLGSISLDKSEWKDLANSIESLLYNRPELFSPDQEVEKLAKYYAGLIQARKLRQAPHADKISNETKPEYQSIDLNSVAASNAQSIGVEHVVISQLSEYGFDKILEELEFSEKQIAYTYMLVAGRLAHPASERETARWLDEVSGIQELLGTDVKVYDNVLHRTAVMLWENHDFIERRLAKSAKEIFSLKETVILYDLTNTYFEGSKKGSAIAKPGGPSKEKRNDRPLVTLALTVDEEGFPKQCKILEGNVSEPGTLASMLEELNADSPLFNSEKTIVMDAGIATEDNLALVRLKNFKYVAVSRKASYKAGFWDTENEKELVLADGKTKLKVNIARRDDEIFLLCHSDAKEAKEKGILTGKLQKFEKELNRMSGGLSKKRNQKKYENILERIGRLKEKYKVGSLYDIDIVHNDGIVMKITFVKNEKGKAKESRIGEYVLRTNRLDLSDEEISKMHRSLTTLEASFRCMKSELGLRPNFHKQDITTTAHIFITVLAYHVIAAVLKKLRKGGINYSWDTIRNILSTHIRVTTAFDGENGDAFFIRTSTTPTPKQQEIYAGLQIKQKPLNRVNLRIPCKTKISKNDLHL